METLYLLSIKFWKAVAGVFMRCILLKNISTWFSQLFGEGKVLFTVIIRSAVYTVFGLAEYSNSNCMSNPN